jgi:hypothetical protein
LVQNPVDRLERLEALGPENSGVVGDLVVVNVVDVDRPGAAKHVLGDEDRVEVAQRSVGHAAQQRR